MDKFQILYLKYVNKADVEGMNEKYFTGRYDRTDWSPGYEYCTEKYDRLTDFWVSSYMDAFAFMKKKMQKKHLVFKEWDERGGEMVGGSDEFKASLFKSEVSLWYQR